MPVISNIASTQNVTIPSKVYSMKVEMWGGGGGGEHLRIIDGTSYSGSVGGNTTFLGLVAGGGGGGGATTKNSVGSGGTYRDDFGWFENTGASVSGVNGSNGSVNTGGAGGTAGGIAGISGGNGASKFITYTSSVSHTFNNETNTTTFSSTSDDITIDIYNQSAADGLPCGNGSNLKGYRVNFNVSYDNADYTISMLSFCQQAAGGSTTGPFTYAGSSSETLSGFNVHFCRIEKNSYIACFTVQTSGQKSSLQGAGGGGSGYIVADITREELFASNTYAPGGTYTFQVGAGGAAGRETNFTSRALAGSKGKGKITYIIQAEIVLKANGEDLEYAIVIGQSANLSWDIFGDADTTYLDNGIGPVPNTGNIDVGPVPNTGNIDVSPTTTTVYTATTTGLGGTGTDTVKVIVYQKPTLEITLPIEVNYGETVKLEYEFKYVNISAKVTPQYRYRNDNNDGLNSVFGDPVDITTLSTSAEEGDEGALVNGEVTLSPIYNDNGPFEIIYLIEAEGSGGTESTSVIVPINIDLSPDNLIIPGAKGLPNEDPLYTPDPVTQPDVVLEIQDVDIPVEIKADKPIKISLDDGNTWLNIREKT